MLSNKINNRFIGLIEDIIQWGNITLIEYNFIRHYIYNIIKQKWYSNMVDTNDVTDEVLLRLRLKWDTYRFDENIGGRKRYIYYYILYSIDDIIATTTYGVDIPQWILKDNNIDNRTLCSSLDDIEELIDKESFVDSINWEMENGFLLDLLVSDITDKERDILVSHYSQWLTQQEIAEKYWVSQQRIGTIIGDVKARFKYNCNNRDGSYL